MNVFKLRDNVIEDYHQYVRSFLNIQDERIHEFVEKELERGALWSDPLVQLNPSYEMGKPVSEFVAENTLHPLCEKIFQKNGNPFKLYRHQERAIRIAAEKKHYVLTTGTGSGKSLTYLIPIIDHILKNDPSKEQVRALIVYPMNALINSQETALKELIGNLGEAEQQITFAQYTGNVKGPEREKLQQHPPHILLTNYMMLEMMMSRPGERDFVDRTTSKLDILVLDELHTYTGRQGADVSMLVRRVRQRSGNNNLLCIGTSATMVTGGSRDEQRKAVAQVAGKIFGVTIEDENVIDEHLKRSIGFKGDITPDSLKKSLSDPLPKTYDEIIKSPLSAWIEENLGIYREDGFYKRKKPVTLRTGAKQLSEITGVDVAECEDKLRQALHTGSSLRHPDNTPVFAVRLHQFISKGDSVYATLEATEKRHLTLSGQRFVEAEDDKDRVLAPLVFCRVCGQEYYQVTRKEADNLLEPRIAEENEQEQMSDGYAVIDSEDDSIWDESRQGELPPNWFRETKKGPSLKSNYKDFVPKRMYVSPDGKYHEQPSESTVSSWYLPVPFLFCLSCGTVYDKRTKEFTKLAPLSSEGRSTATTLLCLSNLTQMEKDGGLDPDAIKILSFTDNRQDASLQAGHFNDFIQVGLLRSAIYKAIPESEGLDHSRIASAVVKALDLPQEVYANNPGGIGIQPKKNLEAFTEYVEYRIFHDLRRGWRVVQPNLEQCGLLNITYPALMDVCQQDQHWQADAVLARASHDNRLRVSKAFLNHLRFSLAIDARCFQGINHEAIKRRVNATLKDPWRFDDDEILVEGKWFAWGSRQRGDASLSEKSVLGKYLRSKRAWPWLGGTLDKDGYEKLLRNLVGILNQGGYIALDTDGDDFRIQLQVDALNWIKGEGKAYILDPVRTVRLSGHQHKLEAETNKYFTQFYTQMPLGLRHLEGREHTGQTSRADREDRESRFRAGDLSSLFCSPTMELGIDIADLNTVNMRNVPPTPANYAQRSGRAGRSGQPAFISTYCSTGSGHDQYFYRKQADMVAGVVTPPRLDLGNEELIKSHVRAVWIARTGLGHYLTGSIDQILDLSNNQLPIKEDIAGQIKLSDEKLKSCIDDSKNIISQCKADIDIAGWYSDEWLEAVVRSSAKEFNEAFDRWRELYSIAHRQLEEALETLRNAHRDRLSRDDKIAAEGRQREAQRQKDLLCNNVGSKDDSDFYPYRYLASESFLPGYNFPRLPVRAFVRSGERGEYLARARFLAVSEYGPRNIVYHEGRKYRVIRSLLPVGNIESRFTKAKICKSCDTFHAGDSLQVDLCEHCRTSLNAENSEFLPNLFEMTTVTTQRTERITCNEEERVRRGYDISTHYRFTKKDGQERKRVAEVIDEKGSNLLNLIYSPSADLWRINRKWKRGKDTGFSLELTRGIWDKKPGDAEDTALNAGVENIRAGVQPFVRDTRNILIIQVPAASGMQDNDLANLQHALQKAICIVYQIDEIEIASERVGEDENRAILFWEAAEGGMGVLQRLIDEPDALSQIAKVALDICHFDPETGEPIAGDIECARACYDCLLSYRNQRDHIVLNRHLIKDKLLALKGTVTKKTYENRTYDEQYEWLRQRTDSRSVLEKKFLDHIYRSGRRLPDFAQITTPNYPTRPDFYYEDGYVCVYCDGTPHDEPAQKAEDDRIRNDLMGLGYRVVVIRYDRDIGEQVEENSDVFGVVRQ
jgi:ATP-dependent helicase YprA (DUF1998 family)